MSTVQEIPMNQDNQFEQEELEDEPIDLDVRNALQNVKIDENIFENSPKHQSTNNKQQGSKKNKKNRGEDFLDYANKNGIQLNLEYEDKLNTKNEKKTYTAPVSKEDGSRQNRHKYQGQKEDHTENQKTFYKNSTNNTYKKTNPYQKKSNFKTGNNKFDLFNMHLPKMMNMLQPIYNPYTQHGMMPSYMMPMPGFQNNNNTGVTALSLPEVDCNSDKSIIDFLEVYLSLENFNQDLYLRNRIDENGFIDGKEIANHNKLRNRGVTFEVLVKVLQANPDSIVETKFEDDGLYLRNKNWETMKDKIISIEQIQHSRKMMKSMQFMNTMNNPINTMNYVGMQNNYFFNGMPHPHENINMGYHGYQGYQQGFQGYQGYQQGFPGYQNYQGYQDFSNNIPVSHANSRQENEIYPEEKTLD